MKKHANLSIFVPHAGCRHMCSFCDQRAISRHSGVPSRKEITQLCESFLPQSAAGVEIAFFGGSFTAMKPEIQENLLSAAYEFVKQNRAEGIRLSTRPDAIDSEVLARLKSYGVTSVELGAQSMSNEVLRLNLRGHTARQVESASRLIKESGFSLGLQMMPGLYGAENYEREANETLNCLLALSPDTMRIYPAVVLEKTQLANWFLSGEYKPLSVNEAVKICAELILKCENAGVKVIRVGLAADAELEKAVLGGPYHPAFRELCESYIFYNIINAKLSEMPKGSYEIQVRPGALSAAKGHKKQNESKLCERGYMVEFTQSSILKGREIQIMQSLI